MGRKKTFSSGRMGLLLVPIFLIISFGVGWKVWQEWQRSRLGEFGRYNVVFSSEKDEGRLVKFVSLDKLGKTMTIVNLPGDLFVETAYGYGKYSLAKVFAVGELDKRGGEALASTVEDLMGVPADGYIRMKDVGDVRDVREITKTDLSVFDLGRFYGELLRMRGDKIRVIDLEKLGVADELLLADGTKAQAVDPERLDYFLRDEFREDDIRRESLTVEILNVGGVPGLGSQAARILTNSGISVVNVGNSEMAPKSCEVRVVTRATGSKTTQRIKKVFGCQILPKEEGRADITVLLRALHPGE